MDKPRCVVAVHQPETLPWLGFVDKLRQCDTFVLLDTVQFEKNYFQNRNRIRTPTNLGWSWLTIPTLTKGRSRQLIVDVKINYATDWPRKHVASLQQHYRRAPCFERYFPALQALYQQRWERLGEWNVEVIQWLAAAFGLRQPIVRSSALGVTGSRSELLVAICQKLEATDYLSGVSGRDYLDTSLFDRAGVAVRFQEFYHPIYRQCYAPFIPGLSAVDLLLNYGEDSLAILVESSTPRVATVFT